MAKASTEFELDCTLGEGAFGKVYLCHDKGDDNQKFAMKVIDLRKSPQDERELALKESKLLADLKHENILQHVTSFESNGALCIVTEFCDGGDLAQYLEQRNKKSLSEPQIVEWFQQICSALEYLHSINVLHRDMKTQNVFLTGPELKAKLGDLGLAKVLEKPTAKAVTFCGSPYYMSPEIFACRPYDSKSDIWAMGVCVYEMCTLERPFDATLMQQLVFKIVHGQLPPMPTDKYSAGLINLMEKMLCKDTDNRPSAHDLLQDKLFKTHKSPKLKSEAVGGAHGKSVRGNQNLISIMNQGKDKAFDMSSLIQTLNEHHKEEARRPQRGRKYQDDKLSSVIVSANVPDKIMNASYVDKDKTLMDKTMKKDLPAKKKPVSTTDVKLLEDDEDMERTLTSANPAPTMPQNPMQMMQRVVKTLTHIFPKNDDGDPAPLRFGADSTSDMEPEAMLLHQIETLQQHCCKILGFALFRRAYDLLDQTDDQMKLEENLIKLLTPEKFAVVGVQLFYCKNFEYNLDKLQQTKDSSA